MAIIASSIHPSTFNPNVPIIWKHILNQLPRCYPASSRSGGGGGGSQRLSKCTASTKTLAGIKPWWLGPSQLPRRRLPQLPGSPHEALPVSLSLGEQISRVETRLHFSFGCTRRLVQKVNVDGSIWVWKAGQICGVGDWRCPAGSVDDAGELTFTEICKNETLISHCFLQSLCDLCKDTSRWFQQF